MRRKEEANVRRAQGRHQMVCNEVVQVQGHFKKNVGFHWSSEKELEHVEVG